ncbi:uncharacterized protein Dwil_GK23982 [Drosophila willistoni]|uniref:BPTI/Kunitz inhibitor domain-containing protein n=1 Tax=Drosophila willistoni TaxID=7260 RepID=B4N6U7_DROWI|nr:male accessory gland serine protease inhibitor [Drosophila willistoni]XP_002069101.1 male accessory gland serine protease inhibitor [Drosophila willistoni]EDW80086.1 uncharacterized protein Dwil_GK23993 [Drosophila willistoni]EDW80087.1 uncharacterized protein Dwil_GK23982 [Drosophila willistoni]
MKFLLTLVCLALYVAHSQAQNVCVGRPVFQVCTGGRDEGNNNIFTCRFTAMNEMWWYESGARRCNRMSYRGCGGNNNRYCSQADCQQKCRR